MNFKEFAEKAQIPVAHTLLGLSCFPGDHILDLGMMGMHGTGCANMAVQNADLLIAIGMRFDDRATANTKEFAPNARVIHIDIDPAEIGKNVPVDVPVVGDIKSVLTALNEEVERREHVDWLSQIEQWRCEYPSQDIRQSDELLPQYIVHQICEATQGDALMVTGVGQNQMFVARYFTFTKPDSLISAGGLGPMGFELPAAMGAKIGRPGGGGMVRCWRWRLSDDYPGISHHNTGKHCCKNSCHEQRVFRYGKTVARAVL